MPAHIAVALLVREGEVLLALRGRTRVHPNCWALPGGRVAPGESAVEAILREIAEEIGLEAGISLGQSRAWRDDEGRRFTCHRIESWSGTPTNREPHLCTKIAWCPLDALPSPLTPETRAFLEAFSLRPIQSVRHSDAISEP